MDSMQKIGLQACLAVALPRDCGHQDYTFSSAASWDKHCGAHFLPCFKCSEPSFVCDRNETHNCGTVPLLFTLDFALENLGQKSYHNHAWTC